MLLHVSGTLSANFTSPSEMSDVTVVTGQDVLRLSWNGMSFTRNGAPPPAVSGRRTRMGTA